MELHVCKNYDDLSEHVADWMVQYICKTLSTKDRFSIVLTGGNTPKKLYELLASEEYNHKIDWSRANVFIGDERFVPFEDERNNSGMIQKTLLDHVTVRQEHVHFMQTENMSPETSANAYEEILNYYFHQTSNFEPQTSNLKPQTSNKPLTSSCWAWVMMHIRFRSFLAKQTPYTKIEGGVPIFGLSNKTCIVLH